MLLDQCSIRDELEFTKMRYTAVTCDPNDFVVCIEAARNRGADGQDDGYTLRQKLYDPGRQTELFIVSFPTSACPMLTPGCHNVQCELA